jgi:hypothetical protein
LILATAPALAQATGTYANEGATGNYGNSDGTQTGLQANQLYGYQNYVNQNTATQTPHTTGGLPTATTTSFASYRESVDLSTLPSGSFTYGFGNPGPQAFMYEKKPAGPMLPAVSTSSYDINTVDAPNIRLPGEYSPGSGGAINLGAQAATFAAATGFGQVANTLNAINYGAATAAQTLNNLDYAAASATQTVNSLSNYFGSGF